MAPVTATVRLTHAFRTGGLLIKTMGGVFGPEWVSALLRASSLAEVRVHRDCGKWCAAFSFLSPELPVRVFNGEKGTLSLVLQSAAPPYPSPHPSRTGWILAVCSGLMVNRSRSPLEMTFWLA